MMLAPITDWSFGQNARWTVWDKTEYARRCPKAKPCPTPPKWHPGAPFGTPPVSTPIAVPEPPQMADTGAALTNYLKRQNSDLHSVITGVFSALRAYGFTPTGKSADEQVTDALKILTAQVTALTAQVAALTTAQHEAGETLHDLTPTEPARAG
jgi:hypothetical protein